MTAIPDDLVPLGVVARHLRVSSRRLERLAIVGEFPRVLDIGGALRVSETDVREWLQERELGRVRALEDITATQVRRSLQSRLDLRRP